MCQCVIDFMHFNCLNTPMSFFKELLVATGNLCTRPKHSQIDREVPRRYSQNVDKTRTASSDFPSKTQSFNNTFHLSFKLDGDFFILLEFLFYTHGDSVRCIDY